jgi:hypothetical protein
LCFVDYAGQKQRLTSIEVLTTSYLGFAHVVRANSSTRPTFLERNVALKGDVRSERFGAPAIQLAVMLWSAGESQGEEAHMILRQSFAPVADVADAPASAYRRRHVEPFNNSSLVFAASRRPKPITPIGGRLCGTPAPVVHGCSQL